MKECKKNILSEKNFIVNNIIFVVFPETTTCLHGETVKQFSLQNLCCKFLLDPQRSETQQNSQSGEAITEARGQEKI